MSSPIPTPPAPWPWTGAAVGADIAASGLAASALLADRNPPVFVDGKVSGKVTTKAPGKVKP